jgi:tetratricopeptide (TPR) repeat protein
VRALAPALLIALASACPGFAADHEELGDRAYLGGAYGSALTEYRLALRQDAAPNAGLRAKAAAAALHAGDLESAAREYLALARADGGRVGEAADGLDRVAQAAATAGNHAALRAAIAGVRELARDRPPSPLTGRVVQDLGGEGARAAELLAVLPAAAAGAPDARQQDSLMFAYASVLGRMGRCEAALGVYEAVARRQRAPGVVPRAQDGAARCALRLGQDALEGGRADRAEEWFRRAASQADDTPVGRAAYLGIGDVRYARGDYVGAVEAYQRALGSASQGDSLARVARERLNRIGNAGTVFP